MGYSSIGLRQCGGWNCKERRPLGWVLGMFPFFVVFGKYKGIFFAILDG